MQKSALISPIVEADVSEEVIKKVERFLRKVTPLVEKELQENFPLYQSNCCFRQDSDVMLGSSFINVTLDWFILFSKWRRKVRRRWKFLL